MVATYFRLNFVFWFSPVSLDGLARLVHGSGLKFIGLTTLFREMERMGSLQEQLFVQAASRSLNHLAKELQKKFEPKKGDRFSVSGITYEIGPPKYVDNCIRFEISSKIPAEEFPEGYSHSEFFGRIEEVCKNTEGKKPASSDMENIVRETREQERKERDYVKLTYTYGKDELYNENDIFREVEEFAKMPGQEPPPRVPGANTIAARFILNRIERALFEAAEKNVQDLIRANDTVRSELKKK